MRGRGGPPAISRGHALGCRHHHASAYDHARANGRCRDPRGPNVLRAIPSLRDSGRSADGSSMPLHTADAPSVRRPTCNGDPPVSNILRSKRSRRWEAAQTLHKRSLGGVPLEPSYKLLEGRNTLAAHKLRQKVWRPEFGAPSFKCLRSRRLIGICR